MTDFLALNWGNLASVVGLLFSILAFVFSNRASKAAREARDSVLRRSIGDDMNWASRSAAEIVTYVFTQKGDMALLRASELMSQTSYFLKRWESKLTEASKDNLLSARAQLNTIHEVLTRSSITDLNQGSRSRLTQACQGVSAIFNEEYGTAMKAGDVEG